MLKHHDPDYYNKLLTWLLSLPKGKTDITKMVSPQTKDKFNDHIKHFIDVDYFSGEGFSILFTNDYLGIIKF